MATKELCLQMCRVVANRSCVTRQCCRGICSAMSLSRSVVSTSHDHHVTLRYTPLSHVKTALYSTHYSKHTDLTYEDLVALIDSGDIQLFDVREKNEIEKLGSIPKAVNVPLPEVKKALEMAEPAFLEHYKVAKPDCTDTNVVFFGQQQQKGIAALEIAHKLGYVRSRQYVGGYEEWLSKQK